METKMLIASFLVFAIVEIVQLYNSAIVHRRNLELLENERKMHEERLKEMEHNSATLTRALRQKSGYDNAGLIIASDGIKILPADWRTRFFDEQKESK